MTPTGSRFYLTSGKELSSHLYDDIQLGSDPISCFACSPVSFPLSVCPSRGALWSAECSGSVTLTAAAPVSKGQCAPGECALSACVDVITWSGKQGGWDGAGQWEYCCDALCLTASVSVIGTDELGCTSYTPYISHQGYAFKLGTNNMASMLLCWSLMISFVNSMWNN